MSQPILPILNPLSSLTRRTIIRKILLALFANQVRKLLATPMNFIKHTVNHLNPFEVLLLPATSPDFVSLPIGVPKRYNVSMFLNVLSMNLDL